MFVADSPILINDHGICTKEETLPTQIPPQVWIVWANLGAREGQGTITRPIRGEKKSKGRGNTDKRVIESGAEAISDKAMNNSK